MNIIVTKSAQETKSIAKLFAKALVEEVAAKGAVVVALDGALGAGKTTFAQGFAEGLGVKEKVKSPTFVLVHEHELKVKRYKYFYHIDCYRLESEKDVSAIGLGEIMGDSENIVLIEWARRIKKALPKRNTIRVTFTYINERTRKINFN